MQTSLYALNALNFFAADVRDGLGPFLGVFLQSKGWPPGEIGLVMTIGGLAGVAATTPLGALVDRLQSKRVLIVAAAVAIVFASIVTLVVPSFTAVAASQTLNGIAAAVVAPAIAGITLGLVKQSGFAHQMGRNEAFNHGGNVVAAVMAGLLGYLFGFAAVFGVMAAMAIAAVAATHFINPRHIDYRAARGLDEKTERSAAGFSVLFTCIPLVILAITLLLFHLGNAAMLPLLGQSIAARGGDPSAYTGATIVVAQLTMVPMALLAARIAEQRGYWLVFVLALAALPVRGALAAWVSGPAGLIPVQMLDGVGAGLLGVAVPGLVARILAGSGRINAGIGAVMTMQGIGASLSPALAGYVAQAFGYSVAFAVLGGVAAMALGLWLAATTRIAAACSPAGAPAASKA
jgi:MFS family permease